MQIENHISFFTAWFRRRIVTPLLQKSVKRRGKKTHQITKSKEILLRSGECGEELYIIPIEASIRVVLDTPIPQGVLRSIIQLQLLESCAWVNQVDHGAATAPITGPYQAPAAGPVDTVIGSLGRRVVFLSRRSINVDGAWFLDKMLALHYRKRAGYISTEGNFFFYSLSSSPSFYFLVHPKSRSPNPFHWSTFDPQ